METCEAPEAPCVAVVEGNALAEFPPDLFIPPDALELLLDAFSGPMDLLLYLVRKQNLDILNLPIARIANQYMEYIRLMEARKLELAADYLLMAAVLLEIKSRMLLPVLQEDGEPVEEDPRLELARRLQAYELMRQCADLLDAMPRMDRDIFGVSLSKPEGFNTVAADPAVTLDMLLQAMSAVLREERLQGDHPVMAETLSVRERMLRVLERIRREPGVFPGSFLEPSEGRAGLVVTLLALLELARQSLIQLVQVVPFGDVLVEGCADG